MKFQPTTLFIILVILAVSIHESTQRPQPDLKELVEKLPNVIMEIMQKFPKIDKETFPQIIKELKSRFPNVDPREFMQAVKEVLPKIMQNLPNLG
ncbi:CLUMA_CG017627, isoform A [Clunio marinus]|uniref:CLUMA_CG017627, isoform A n=1 Tax=Clunio marinus TaxID=568069 RepID=A0A1J1IYC1_9DIPT|nr:CLUMA_CG017627, isoform A [Clunio marinus]